MNAFRKIFAVAAAAACLIIAFMLVSCNTDKQTYAYYATIPNAGFERGDLSGWTVDGDFTVQESSNKTLRQNGRYYAQSSNVGKGEITSSRFTLQDTGYISFLIGAGNGDCYVAVYADNVLVKKISNPYFTVNRDDVMRRVLVNLTEHKGKEIYVKIVDNSTDLLYSYINVDAFDVNVTVTDKAVYKSISIEV